MPKVKIEGKVIQFPDGLSQEQLLVAVKNTQQQLANKGPDKKSLRQKVWASLSVPEQMSRKGLGMMASAVPETIGGPMTGNIAGDVARGLPRVAAETIAEAAPGFISRGSIVTGGLLRGGKAAAPIIKGAGRLAGKGLEALSGLEHQTPGVLAEAAKDATLIAAKGRKAAAPLYKAATEELGKQNIFQGMYKPEQIIDTAKEYIAKGGILEPAEALAYRKALDIASKSKQFVKSAILELRQEADAMAKAGDKIRMADPVYARGVKAEALRQLLPVNKYGGASAFKTMLGGLTGLVPLAAMSPISQGAVATGAGAAARGLGALAGPTTRTAVKSGAAIGALVSALMRRQYPQGQQ